MSWNSLFDPGEDEEDLIPSQPQRLLPDELLLLGETSDNQMLPLQVDSDDRLAVELATPEYDKQLPVPVPSSTGDLFDGPGVIDAMLFTNSTASAVTVRLAVGGKAFMQVAVAANSYVYKELLLPIASGDKLQGNGTTNNAVKLFLSVHTGLDVLR